MMLAQVAKRSSKRCVRAFSTRPTEPVVDVTQQQQQDDEKSGLKLFSFAQPEAEKREVETFENPAYWDEDFPSNFDDAMKHEVEKLEIFHDFTMLLDDSWQQQIHSSFDGSAIELEMNYNLEDFDDRLYIEDKTTFDTKVIMHVPMSCFVGLSSAQKDVVKQLAGPRYQPNKDRLKLTEDRYASRVHNHKRLCDILTDLTTHASSMA